MVLQKPMDDITETMSMLHTVFGYVYWQLNKKKKLSLVDKICNGDTVSKWLQTNLFLSVLEILATYQPTCTSISIYICDEIITANKISQVDVSVRLYLTSIKYNCYNINPINGLKSLTTLEWLQEVNPNMFPNRG